jgi:hypothetical protein
MPNATAARRPKFPPSDPPPAASAVACGSRCPGCPECSLEHDEYAPRPAVLGAALGLFGCYACDDDASGTRDRSFDLERAIVPACGRHADQVAA